MITGLSHIGLTAGELEQSVRFYRDAFGFELLSDAERKGEGAERITGIPGIHTRNVYLSVTPSQHLEIFGFYNPKTIPPQKETNFRAGIFYTAFMGDLLQSIKNSIPAEKEPKWLTFLRAIEESPYRGSRLTTLQDRDGLALRVVECEGQGLAEQRPMRLRILYPALIVRDLGCSLEFFSEILGLEIELRGKDQLPVRQVLGEEKTGAAMNWALLKSAGGVCLKLIEILNLEVQPALPWMMQRVGFTHLAFAVKDLETFYEKLLNKGVRFVSPPQIASAGPHKGGKGVYLETEYETIIELVDSPLTQASGLKG